MTHISYLRKAILAVARVTGVGVWGWVFLFLLMTKARKADG